MLKTVLFLVIAAILYIPAKVNAADRIIAVVNQEVITQSEADAYLKMITLELSQQYSDGELEKRVSEEKKGLVSKMIEDRIILQEAKRKGIQARQDKVRLRIEQMKDNFVSGLDFDEALKQKGLTIKDLQDKLSQQIIMREVVETEVKNKIVVSPDEVTKFYEKHKDEFLQPEQRVVEIVSTEDKGIVEKLHLDLKAGGDFQAVARQHQANYSSETISKLQTRSEISSEVFTIKLNETTGPIKLDHTFYIFKLLEIIPSRMQDLASVNNNICTYLFQEKFDQNMTEWLEGLKSKSYIEIKADL